MNFLDQGSFREEVTIQVPFLKQGLDVGRFYAVPFGDPLVTGTKGAEVLTERQVNVQTDPLTSIAFLESPDGSCLPVIQADSRFIPKGNRRVAGVPRTGNVVFLDQ